MLHDNNFIEFNFKFSQCDLLDETTTDLDIPINHRRQNKKKKQQPTVQEQQPIPLMSILKKELRDIEIYEEKLSAFYGLKVEEEQPVPLMSILEKDLRDIEIYEEKLSAFCGLWEDYPRRHYRMEFRIEMGQLVGYSNIDGGKALASYDGNLINMIIIHPKETGRPLDHYRGRLGWNQKYIVWEKEDSSRENGWRSTRRWVRIE